VRDFVPIATIVAFMATLGWIASPWFPYGGKVEVSVPTGGEELISKESEIQTASEETIIWQINGLDEEVIDPGGVHQCGAPSDNVYDCEVTYDITDPLAFGCIIFRFGSNSSWLCP